MSETGRDDGPRADAGRAEAAARNAPASVDSRDDLRDDLPPGTSSAALPDAEDEDAESDAEFFSKSFALNSTSRDAERFDAAFAGGLRSLFDAEDEDEEGDEEDSDSEGAGTRGEDPADLSDAERIQRDLELERREALDATILQNDADFLFEAGEKYEAPRASDSDFDRRAPVDDADEAGAFHKAIVRPESILEAMLFVGDRDNKPLLLSRACEFIRNLKESEALAILRGLNARYDREGAPYRIVKEGAGYKLALRDGYEDVVARFGGKAKEFKLSQTAIDVLALIAYRQPISRDEILEVRPSGANALSQLSKRDLISVEKSVSDGKTRAIYRTTDRFLKLFNLRSLDDLPIIGDVDYR